MFSSAFLRVLATRWVGLPPRTPKCILLGTASLSTLTYEHNQSEPVIGSPVRPPRELRRFSWHGEEVIVGDEEPFHGAIKYHDLDVLVGFDCRDNGFELRNVGRPKIFKGGQSKVTRQ